MEVQTGLRNAEPLEVWGSGGWKEREPLSPSQDAGHVSFPGQVLACRTFLVPLPHK